MSNLGKFETLKKDFLDSLSEDKYNLLSIIAKNSSCITDFIFRHTEELDYIYDNLDKPSFKREQLIEEALNLVDIKQDEEFIRQITFFKMKHFSRIVARDLMKKDSLLNLMEEYSYLADACLEVAYKRAFEKYKNRYGYPIDEATGDLAKGSIIALGKHGGTDLNYYSDIDIMYIYSNEGKTDGANSISNREFFSFLFRDMTGWLTKRNSEGIAWNIDLDLRPEGKKGLIAYSLPVIEAYYWSVGRIWERYMLIKARHSAGDISVSNEFMQIITPFVYRKHTDVEVVKEIVSMKKLIEEYAKIDKSSQIDIKKSEGGIREIEFFVQVFQLLYGGYDKDLRERETIKALRILTEKGYVKKEDSQLLEEAYIFYRNLEHRIQLKNCVQTQILNLKDAPEFAEKLGLDENQFLNKLNYYRNKVKSIFENILPEEEKQFSILQNYIYTKQNYEEAINYLREIGFKDAGWALNLIESIFISEDYSLLTENQKNILFEYLSEFEDVLKRISDKESFIINFVKLLIDGKLLRIFVSALEQNKKLSQFLIDISNSSDYITNIIAKDKEVLDYVFSLDKDLENEEQFLEELKIINIPEEKEKLKKLKKIVEVVSTLRYLSDKDIKEEKLTKLNEAITNLADFIIKRLYRLNNGKDLAIYGLGKLGSREMNIGSDLDLIFVFKDEESKYLYSKIPSQIVRDLTEKNLYQIDLRLRPYGKAGELSPSVSFYERYFKEEARAWEKLAWTKSRFIVGDFDIENLIRQFLFSKDIDKSFIDEAVEMRYRLEGLVKETENSIDIKLGKGGIADIEFLVQIFYLRNKIRNTSILEGVKNIAPDILEDFIFLRDMETKLRMIKGSSSSKLQKESKELSRIANFLNIKEEELFNQIKNSKNRIREKFIKTVYKL
ncbi:bifunctional [glutamate--ammonia ligase]-adenylyl-L-tyrosine phosphorylase/[glutamate--ammonia-ligase] adenylyltransferase [Venenivibrio stagnispumantis]|uniref:Glutamate-ammonia-ligase adenylyltransferase n=1 Tax=Venenivibrio stagnispumantis TaxID=407998 RepID=A0AA46ADQ1_9AQUI|nr:glutamine-synthetase adenylyltransferase [Venenivibrio stagnispumantis]MCW4573007.1 glutamine-synthetase adenylyltransferase [Venenivibrio stagnispumantis]SMP07829.1 glutamate-ammonia-ligase adenylyltransferase [Venenivibrio stagnispumantis]